MKIKLAFIAILFFLFDNAQVLMTSNYSKDNKLVFELKNKNGLDNATTALSSNHLLDVSQSFESASASNITVFNFPNSLPKFQLDSNASGWTDLNVSTNILVNNMVNVNLVDVVGVTQINNNSGKASYQFAIGVFVDNQLKAYRIFNEASENSCDFNKFNLSGVLENLSVGEHTVKVYACNLPKTTKGYSAITYGGNASSCAELNKDDARINLTVQVSE